jgi:hypothetical protein
MPAEPQAATLIVDPGFLNTEKQQQADWLSPQEASAESKMTAFQGGGPAIPIQLRAHWGHTWAENTYTQYGYIYTCIL